MIWWPFTRETIFCLLVFIDLKHILLSSLMEAKSRIERVLSAAGFITAESVQQLQSCSHFFTHISSDSASSWSLMVQLMCWWLSAWTDMMPSLIQWGSTGVVSVEVLQSPSLITTNNYCRQQSKVVGFLSMGDQHHLLCTDPLLLPHQRHPRYAWVSVVWL